MHEALLASITLAAVVRSAWLVVGLVRVIPVHLRARTRQWGWAEVFNFVELPVFLCLTALLVVRPPPIPHDGLLSLAAATLGACLALAGVGVSIWAIHTTVRRRVILDAGHFVKDEHPLVTNGAYGFVRNPMYLGIILLWLGIAAGFQSPGLLAVSVLYVVPVLWRYIRAEEEMMVREFGDEFVRYAGQVGRLLPKWRRSAA